MRTFILFTILLLGCQGRGQSNLPTDPGTASNNGTPTVAATNNGTVSEELAPFRPAEPAMRRLTAAEYRNTIHDILGADLEVPAALEPDTAVNGFSSIGNAQLATSRLGVEQYETAALDIAAQVMRSPTRVGFVGCSDGLEVDSACTVTFLTSIGERLFRRPLSDEEVQQYVAIAELASTELNDSWSGLEFGLAGLLQSPHFLYRTEWGDQSGTEARRRLTQYEIASRLSYFLWASAPDEALLAAAREGKLERADQVRTEAARLLDDPRAKRGLRRMWVEFLGLDGLRNQTKDPELYPEYSPELSDAMLEETLRVIEHFGTGDRDFREIYSTRTTFVTPALAALYGIEGIEDAEPSTFTQVELDDSTPRRGILGHASLLSQNAHAAMTSPTLRGLIVRQTLLCQPILPPPPNVDTTVPEYGGEGTTLRERLSVHMENPGCSSCHLQMDPIGFGFEHFDAIGRYRTEDNGAPVDSTGDLDGVTFDDASGLAVAVSQSPAALNCMVRKIYRHGLGRIEGDGEEVVIRDLLAAWEEDDYRLRELLLGMVSSDGFLFVEGAR